VDAVVLGGGVDGGLVALRLREDSALLATSYLGERRA